MPNRILRESICTSEDVDGLSPEAEVFFYRLIVQADDFGRADARPTILRARCFPLRMVPVEDISRWLAELVAVGIAQTYTVAGKCYLELSAWAMYQRRRAAVSKFPPPPADDREVQTSAAEERGIEGSRNRGIEERGARKDAPAPDGAPEENGSKPFHLADAVNLHLVVTLKDRYRRRKPWDGVTEGLLTGLVLGGKHSDGYGARAVNAAIEDLYENAEGVRNPSAYLLERAQAHADSQTERV